MLNILEKAMSEIFLDTETTGLSVNDRHKIIEILWKIVYSDGTSDNFESNLIRRVCGLLYVPDKDSGMIKIKVKDSLK